MARPTKPESEKLTERVGFRLTKIDFDAYQKKVAESGLTESEFFRTCVLTNKTQVVAKARKSDNSERILFLVRKSGNNINQIAHRINADHLAGKVSEKTYIEVLEELQAISAQLKAGLYVA